MDKVYLLSLFQTQKPFLKRLYKAEENVNQTLLVANDHSLNVLVRILHLIANGEIVLRKSDSDLIKKSLRMKKLLQFESKKYFLQVLNGSRDDKLKLLRQFSSLYPTLLYSFFNMV
jgi:intein-encoded DNA endonuclease-like protein